MGRLVLFDVHSAHLLALDLHKGQTDRAGQPYAAHVCRVADALAALGAPDYVVMAGYLHDSVEDGHATLQDLVDAGVPDRVVALVGVLSRERGEAYADYVARVASVPDAVLVKRADIADNTRPERLALLDAATRERLERKYADALAVL